MLRVVLETLSSSHRSRIERDIIQCCGLSLLLIGGLAQAATDSEPPTVRGFDVEPTLLDIAAGDATLSLQLAAADASGLNWASTRFENVAAPAHQKFVRLNPPFASASTTFSPGDPTGEWRVHSVYLVDAVGNETTYDEAALAALGGTTRFQVSAMPSAACDVQLFAIESSTVRDPANDLLLSVLEVGDCASVVHSFTMTATDPVAIEAVTLPDGGTADCAFANTNTLTAADHRAQCELDPVKTSGRFDIQISIRLLTGEPVVLAASIEGSAPDPVAANDDVTLTVAIDDPQDADGDGLADIDEGTVGTDPDKKDTDGDGHWDEAEVAAGSDPLDPASQPEEFGGMPAWMRALIATDLLRPVVE